MKCSEGVRFAGVRRFAILITVDLLTYLLQSQSAYLGGGIL